MLVVVSLGGNALLERGRQFSFALQRANIERAAHAVAALVASGHRIVLTHGNGPQIGHFALRSADASGEETVPLDILGAETEGAIGYMLEQAMRNAQRAQPVATLLTQAEIDPDDPAFTDPQKPIGPLYTKEEAGRIAQATGWTFRADGAAFRRVVPSPRPRGILGIEAIRLLLAHGLIVICGGGGGIPVRYSATGNLGGVDAVIDKDFTSAMIAQEIGTDVLLLLTDVDGVYADWEGERRNRLQSITAATLGQYRFAPGSMGPKVDAACSFVAATGKAAGIGRLDEAQAILDGRAGTRITR